MDTEVMLTTFDNPYDPFEEFASWWLYDIEHGYNTCALLGRLTGYTEELSVVEEDEDRVRAIDAIIDNDFLNIYKKKFRTIPEEIV